MKVLHISNVLNNSGWSKQAEHHLLALDSAGVDVAARHVDVINSRNADIHPRVLELLQKDAKYPDIIIQNVLPSMLEKTGRARCVSYFVCETSNFRSSGWAHKLNQMDLVLCPCYYNKLAAIDSDVKGKIDIVPEAIDTSKYNYTFPSHPLREQHKDKFLFLCISEWTVRKNIDAIVRAFHTEFSPNEPVELVIKTTPVGMSNPQVDINAKLEVIKKGLKLYNTVDRYKQENVICGFVGEADMASLIQSCDCYVTASRAEAFNISLAEAMSAGKICVAPDHSGMDYINDKNSYVIKSYVEPCYAALDTLPDLYSSAEQWNEPSISSIMEGMRSAFEKRSLNLKKIQAARESVKKFSYENVGKIYKNILEKL